MSHAYWVKVADENIWEPLGVYRMEVPGGWLYRHVTRVRVWTFWGEREKVMSALVFVPLPSDSRGDWARKTRAHEWYMSDDGWDAHVERTRS